MFPTQNSGVCLEPDGCVRKFEWSKPFEKFFTRSTVLSTHINLWCISLVLDLWVILVTPKELNMPSFKLCRSGFAFQVRFLVIRPVNKKDEWELSLIPLWPIICPCNKPRTTLACTASASQGPYHTPKEQEGWPWFNLLHWLSVRCLSLWIPKSFTTVTIFSFIGIFWTRGSLNTMPSAIVAT